jgi:hypothetical protein
MSGLPFGYCDGVQGAKYVRHLDNDPLDHRTQVSRFVASSSPGRRAKRRQSSGRCEQPTSHHAPLQGLGFRV